MTNQHPKEKDPKTVPHDPRNEPMPTGPKEHPTEKAEEEARKDAGIGMTDKESEFPKELSPDQVIVNPTQGDLPTGIQTGQTTRGSYSTDPASGGGRYGDHRAGEFGTADVAQPGNDQFVEPDPIDPLL